VAVVAEEVIVFPPWTETLIEAVTEVVSCWVTVRVRSTVAVLGSALLVVVVVAAAALPVKHARTASIAAMAQPTRNRIERIKTATAVIRITPSG